MQNLIDYRIRHTLPRGESAFNALYGKIRNSAKVRGHLFLITKEKFRFLSKERCFYCNCEPYQEYKNGKYNGGYIYNGLDRIDPSIGYIDSNVVPSCGKCNVAKQSMKFDEFVSWINRVHSNLKLRRY